MTVQGMHADAGPKSHVSGLTLIELTIVLILIAIIASFSIPRFFMVTEINLRTSARYMAETLLEVSSLSSNFSTPFWVQYDFEKNRYCFKRSDYDQATARWVAFFEDDKAELVSGDPLARKRCTALKAGVFFKDIETLTGTEKKQEKGTLLQEISPRGITDPLVIHLGDRKGRIYTLFVQRYGGRVEIREGRVEYKKYLEELLE